MTAPRIVDLHAELAGLSADDHAQYLLLAGRAGGQTAYGGTAITDSLDLYPNTQSPPVDFATDGRFNIYGRLNFLGFSDLTAVPGINYQLMFHGETVDCSGQGSIIPQGFWYQPTFDYNTAQTFGGAATFQDGSIWRESALITGPHNTFSLGSYLGGPRYQVGHAGVGLPPSGLYGFNSTPAADLVGGTSLTMPAMAGYSTNFPFPLQTFLGLQPLRNGAVCTRYSHFIAYSAIANALTLHGGSTITTEVGLDLQNLARGTTAISVFSDALGAYMDHAGLITYTGGVLRLGTAAVTDHGLGAGDVLVGGQLEVDGLSYFDARANFYSSLRIYDNQPIGIGSADDSLLDWSTGQATSHTLVWGLGPTSKSIIFTDWNNVGIDHDHAAQSHPTQFIHSALNPNTDYSEYLGLSYLGLQAGTMETDRAKFDLTLRAVSALAGATVNQDGGIINLVPGKNALGGGVDGSVRIWHPDEIGSQYLDILFDASGRTHFRAGVDLVYFGVGAQDYFRYSSSTFEPLVANLRHLGGTTTPWLVLRVGQNANSGIYWGLSQTSRLWYDQSGTDTLQLNGTKQFVVNTGIMTRLTSGACVESGDAIYFGDPAINGTWRIIRSGNDFAFERREAGTYVEKGAFTAV